MLSHLSVEVFMVQQLALPWLIQLPFEHFPLKVFWTLQTHYVQNTFSSILLSMTSGKEKLVFPVYYCSSRQMSEVFPHTNQFSNIIVASCSSVMTLKLAQAPQVKDLVPQDAFLPPFQKPDASSRSLGYPQLLSNLYKIRGFQTSSLYLIIC